jgi:hypothetical protein
MATGCRMDGRSSDFGSVKNFPSYPTDTEEIFLENKTVGA